jgi:succinate dehydrogenase / fumarate reductase cytochrome b subunit
MQRAATFLGSSIGKKVVMAASGLVLYGFVIGHMVGNLQIYLGPKAINDYAEFLQHFLHGQGIWLVRGGLLVAVGLHVWTAVTLTLSNWSARPTGYRDWQAAESTYASRTMVWSGPILAAFVVYHLAHFTLGTAHPEFVRGDVFRNVVVGFQNPFASAFYILAMGALGLHMYHGFWSMLQTLGLSHPRWNAVRLTAALALAAIVVIGNISIPLAVLTGLVHL